MYECAQRRRTRGLTNEAERRKSAADAPLRSGISSRMPILRNPRHERFYVYALVDSRVGKPFYIGKGCGRRAATHLSDYRANRGVNARKHRKIYEILAIGGKVEIKFLATGLSSRTALDLERDYISIAKAALTNLSRGEEDPAKRYAEVAWGWLARVKPFPRWLRERPREAWEIAIYKNILLDLFKMANFDGSINSTA